MFQSGNKHLFCFRLKTEIWGLSGRSYYTAAEPIRQSAGAGKHILFPMKLLDVHGDTSITRGTILFIPLKLKCQTPVRFERWI